MPCNRAAPEVAQVARGYQGRVAVVGVAGFDTTEAMRGFVDRHGLGDVTQINDASGAVRAELGVIGQPAWVFVDGASGRIDRVPGELPRAEVEQRLDALAR